MGGEKMATSKFVCPICEPDLYKLVRIKNKCPVCKSTLNIVYSNNSFGEVLIYLCPKCNKKFIIDSRAAWEHHNI